MTLWRFSFSLYPIRCVSRRRRGCNPKPSLRSSLPLRYACGPLPSLRDFFFIICPSGWPLAATGLGLQPLLRLPGAGPGHLWSRSPAFLAQVRFFVGDLRRKSFLCGLWWRKSPTFFRTCAKKEGDLRQARMDLRQARMDLRQKGREPAPSKNGPSPKRKGACAKQEWTCAKKDGDLSRVGWGPASPLTAPATVLAFRLKKSNAYKRSIFSCWIL